MIFFDEDCNSRYYPVEAGTMTVGDLDPLVDKLSGGDVGVFVIGVGGQNAMYPGAKAIDEFIDGFRMELGLEQPWMHGLADKWAYRNAANIVVLLNHGIDSNRYLLDRARLRGMSPWITIRMNDQHGTYLPFSPMHSRLWMEHPEYRTRSHFPESGLSYEHEIVRSRALNIVREVMDLYDADGYVIDWMRIVPHFDDGKGPEHIPEMNALMRGIREYADALSAKRGHRIEIIARVPATVKASLYHGLDAVSWAAEKLVDRLVISPKYIRSYLLDAGAWKKAIGDPDFPVIANIDTAFQPYPGYPAGKEQGVWQNEPFDERQLPFIRGACRAALALGSDGVYMFNFMSVRDENLMPEIFKECGSLEHLRGKDFAIDITYDDLDMAEGDFLKGWRAGSTDTYFSQWRKKMKEAGTYPWQLPRELPPGGECRLEFFTGEVTEAAPGISVKLEGMSTAEVKFNGTPCVFRDGEYRLQPGTDYRGKKAIVEVRNTASENVELLRASAYFRFRNQ